MRNKLILVAFLIVVSGIFLNACQSEKDLEYVRYYANGKLIYENRCQNCHSNTGSGLGELIPPLTDRIFLKRNRSNLSCIVKNGLSGPIKILNKEYNEQMPANSELANIEIAEVLTYITNSFGNKQGIFTTGDVEIDLKKCK